jgi:hypothetical protein
MSQTRATGAAAAGWGLTTGHTLAVRLGARSLSAYSNECIWDGRRVVIKCAAVATDNVGVTFKMLDRLDSVIGAFQRDDGSFDLWSITAETFKNHMRHTRSRGPSAGRVGILGRQIFEQHGTRLDRLPP